MENSILYSILYDRYCDYREGLEREETFWFKRVKEMESAFEKSFSEEQLNLIDDYKRSVILWQEGMDIKFGKKLLNTGVMIGMQLQKAFDEEDC